MHISMLTKTVLPITILCVIGFSLLHTNTPELQYLPENQEKTQEASQNPTITTTIDDKVLGVTQQIGTTTVATPSSVAQTQPPAGANSAGQAQQGAITKKTTPFETAVLYGLINAYRKEEGSQPLRVNKALEKSAQKKVADMLAHSYFTHQDANQNESWYLFQASGYHYKSAGENLSFGYDTPWKTFTAWQESPTHNEQLLKSEYQDMGLAVDCSYYKTPNQPFCIVVLHLGVE